jgi:hypothetical protein
MAAKEFAEFFGAEKTVADATADEVGLELRGHSNALR